MVVDHVKDDAETGLVKSLDHLLELLDACDRVVWVCRERAFHGVVVQRLVSPVVLIVFQTGLVNGSEVCRREKLHICHSQFLEMVDTCSKSLRVLRTFLCQGEVLASVADS